MAKKILDRVQADAREALKTGERERAAALRLVVDSLQQDAKLGKGDELAVLRRERRKRLEAADAFRGGGRDDQAQAEEAEAELIDAYLPAELSDQELIALVEAAIAESGAGEQRQMGEVMSIVMPKVAGRADGKRVSAAVRQRLGG
ncbi:MAG TPA: GatB/YqeY domain-containing protein, partial [Solirubrobacterales bacterium]|nr:GatB/YqeY domain-containing protein [Solirubrobacterales bacterium]